MAEHLCFTVADRSYFSLLKKEIHALCGSAGFPENKVGEIDIVVAEIVSNLVKHAGGGKLLMKFVRQQDIDGIELISIDNGAGIADVSRMMADGISTTNTLGHGLGAIQRLSNFFQIYSLKDWGTVLLSRIFKDDLPYTKRGEEIRSIVVPKPGEIKCGDGFSFLSTSAELRLFLGDGLGHGEEAHNVVTAAIQSFQTSTETEAVEVIRSMHKDVRKTRGLVGTAALFDRNEKRWRILGVGNINTRMFSGLDLKTHMSYNGIIGYNIPNTMKDHEFPADPAAVMILCSDGIKTKWDLAKYPGILKNDLSVLAAAIFKDHARQTDDMSVVAVRLN